MVGLRPEVVDVFPRTVRRLISAWRWRARWRSIRLVFLDEPTSGLDPIGAGDFDELGPHPAAYFGADRFHGTHDLDSLYTACDRMPF